VAYSSPYPLVGTEGALLGEKKERKKGKEKKERIGRNGRKCPKINFLLWPCPHFPNLNLKYQFGALPNLGGPLSR